MCSGAVCGPWPHVEQHGPECLTAGVQDLEGWILTVPECGPHGAGLFLARWSRNRDHIRESSRTLAVFRYLVGVRWKLRRDKNIVPEFWRLLSRFGRPDTHTDSVGAASGRRGSPYGTCLLMLFEAWAGGFPGGQLLCFPPGKSEKAPMTGLPAGWHPLPLRIKLLAGG